MMMMMMMMRSLVVVVLFSVQALDHSRRRCLLFRGGSLQAKSPLEEAESRLEALLDGLDERFVIAKTVAQKAMDGVTTVGDLEEVDELLAEAAASLASRHPDHGKLASRVAVERLRRRTNYSSFSETLMKLSESGGEANLLMNRDFIEKIKSDKNFRQRVDAACATSTFEQDLDYFGFKTLEKSYLIKSEEGQIRETPSQMLMRSALGVHEGWKSEELLEKSLKTFDLMASRHYIHASPTLFHAGTSKPHLASCFLLGAAEDSIEGIYHCLGQCALISKAAGGIGVSVSSLRASGSKIRGTGGESNGLVPILRVFDATARYVDQGGGKRPGAYAAYVEPWHADIFDVLDLKKNHGKEERRARDLFYALWIPDLFMKRVKSDGMWSLMCPDECPGLATSHSEAFEMKYEQYEKEKRFKRQVPARQLWRAILDAQIETGTPYMLYKDACNAKSNHKHMGTIQCSNLCCEIVEFANRTDVAVCNLASLVLPTFVNAKEKTFDFEKLRAVTKTVVENLDATIDSAAYPSEATERSNKNHRPIGVGVQGLADAFLLMRLPFDSEAARTLNKQIFETIYFAALEKSVDLAKLKGPYASYIGSPASFGKLQPDLWIDHAPTMSSAAEENASSLFWDWDTLRASALKHGIRNSLLVAPMPTASTAQIVGVNECFEPYTSNLYARRVNAGEFVVANQHLVKDLASRGLWDDAMRKELLHSEGSVQPIERIPKDLKDLYKTVWELKQKTLVDLAADRGPFVDQSQSLNAFIAEPDYNKLTAFHFYGWAKGLKTGMYYLRTKPAATALRFTLDPRQRPPGSPENDDAPVCISCSG